MASFAVTKVVVHKKRAMDFSIALLNLLCQEMDRNKKGHGSLEAAHGLHFRFKCLYGCRADLLYVLPAPPISLCHYKYMFHLVSFFEVVYLLTNSQGLVKVF